MFRALILLNAYNDVEGTADVLARPDVDGENVILLTSWPDENEMQIVLSLEELTAMVALLRP